MSSPDVLDRHESDAPPQATLRERHQQATRLAILEAYLTLAHRDGAMTVSVPAVARRSGVSVRTIYRYFPNKVDLQTAAAYHMSEQALDGGSMSESTPENLLDQLTMLWRSLAENIPAVIAERVAPAGREIRITRLDGARKTARRALVPDADAKTVDLLVAVTSSSMFLELVERMQYRPEDAAAMAVRLIELLLADAKEGAHT